MKKDYFEKRKKRLTQKIKLLVSRPDFQKEIIELRKKWNIPVDGVKSEELNREWNKNLNTATDKYYDEEWPKHRKELQHLQTRATYVEYKNREDELNNAAPLNAFGIDIKAILKKYLLNPKWKDPIRRYILFNDPEKMGLSIGVTITGHLNDYEPTEYQLSLQIDEDTTLEDIKEIWPDVMAHQERLIYRKQKKFQPIKNFERDKEAYDLKQSGKSYNNIADILSKKYDKAISYDDVASYIKRYKKKIGIN